MPGRSVTNPVCSWSSPEATTTTPAEGARDHLVVAPPVTEGLCLANSVRLVPWPRVVAEQRVDEHVDAAAAVEEGSARSSLELESTLLRDPLPRACLGVIPPEHRLRQDAQGGEL